MIPKMQMPNGGWIRTTTSLLVATLTISAIPVDASSSSLLTRLPRATGPTRELRTTVDVPVAPMNLPTHAVRRLVGTDTCPHRWQCAQIGDPNTAGSQKTAGDLWTISSTGVLPDSVRFVWRSIGAAGSVSVRVASQPSPGGDREGAGVMMRDGMQPGAAYYAFYATTNHLLAVRYRAARNAGDPIITIPGDASAYLCVARAGATFTAFTSADGRTWRVVPKSKTSIRMSPSVPAGVAVGLDQPGVAVLDHVASMGGNTAQRDRVAKGAQSWHWCDSSPRDVFDDSRRSPNLPAKCSARRTDAGRCARACYT